MDLIHGGTKSRTDWKADKRWSDRFIPEIKRILGSVLLAEADWEEDARRNTDLIVIKMESVRIACRVRRYSYYAECPNEFTIRSDRPFGIKSELFKVVEGFGQYLFYGFSNESETKLHSWNVINLNVFRGFFVSYMAKNSGKLPGRKMRNKDGSSSFMVFDFKQFPRNIIFASSKYEY